MAQFDVWTRRRGPGLLLDCQSDFLNDLETRFVVPLVARTRNVHLIPRLNPTFEVGGEILVMTTQHAFNLYTVALGRRVGSLSHEHHRIVDAIDFLLSGI